MPHVQSLQHALPPCPLRAPHGLFNCWNERRLTVAVLQGRGHDPDKDLDAAQRADSAAYTALVTETLHVALLYSWWVEDDNYEIIRNEYAGKLPVPLCYYLPWTMRRKVNSQAATTRCVPPCPMMLSMRTPTGFLSQPDASLAALFCCVLLSTTPGTYSFIIITQLARRNCILPGLAYHRGEEALQALSIRYGSRPFFHGAAASAVDAAVFAFLTAILRPPLPNNRLRKALLSHPNLVELCERMCIYYFGSSAPLPQPPAPDPVRPPTTAAAAAEAASAEAGAA